MIVILFWRWLRHLFEDLSFLWLLWDWLIASSLLFLECLGWLVISHLFFRSRLPSPAICTLYNLLILRRLQSFLFLLIGTPIILLFDFITNNINFLGLLLLLFSHILQNCFLLELFIVKVADRGYVFLVEDIIRCYFQTSPRRIVVYNDGVVFG